MLSVRMVIYSRVVEMVRVVCIMNFLGGKGVGCW